MTKIIRIFTLTLLIWICLSLTSCTNRYADIAGTYESYMVTDKYGYSYYTSGNRLRIILKPNGQCRVEYGDNKSQSFDGYFQVRKWRDKLFIYKNRGLIKNKEKLGFNGREITVEIPGFGNYYTYTLKKVD